MTSRPRRPRQGPGADAVDAHMAGPGRRRSEPGDGVAEIRKPPHSVEAEQAVLGGLMLDSSAWDAVADIVVADDF